MQKLRIDYNKDRNERIAKLHKEFGLSLNEIALNTMHNPEKLSQQRIYQIVRDYERNIKESRN